MKKTSITTKRDTAGYICPFIDDFVDCLYTDQLNDLVEKSCQTDIDKRTFMMFIMMYFSSYLSMNDLGGRDRKTVLKVFMSDLIMNSEKRQKCVELYRTFEQSVAKSITNGEFVSDTNLMIESKK